MTKTPIIYLLTLIRYFEAVAARELMPGVIAAIQTFGDRVNFHPHLHFLVTEAGVDGAGLFHKVLQIDDSRLAELFGRKVLVSLVFKEFLSKLTFVAYSSLRDLQHCSSPPRRSS